MISKTVGLGLALAIVAAACGGVADESTGTAAETVTPTSAADPGVGNTTIAASDDGPAVGALPTGPSALESINAPGFPEPLIDPQEIVAGGPPPDGIPPIENPVFIPVAEAQGFLTSSEAVVALEIDGEARAYPVRVMIWHEIVNDTVAGVPVSVTYCPLCNSAVSYRREVRGVETTFGTSGLLFASALVMYDRATESLWTHFDGRAVVGMLAGDQLEVIASPLLAWQEFEETYPDGMVLDPGSTGYARAYGENPYVGYDDESTQPFLFLGDADSRAVAKQRIVGIELDGDAVALPLDQARGDGAAVTELDVGGGKVVVFWREGQATSLESSSIAGGRDVGSVSVFIPEAEGRALTFAAVDGEFVDEETGSTWNLAGVATSGDFTGAKLERVPHLDTFWFAWATYRPDTVLIGSEG